VLEWLVALHSEGRRRQSQMAPTMRIAESRDYEIGDHAHDLLVSIHHRACRTWRGNGRRNFNSEREVPHNEQPDFS